MPDPWTQLRKHWAESAKTQRDWTSPREKPHLEMMRVARNELERQGWQDIIYCPKGGSWFLAICAGSTGVSQCCYRGEWPTGSWWIADAGDEWPAYPILWKPMPSSI